MSPSGERLSLFEVKPRWLPVAACYLALVLVLTVVAGCGEKNPETHARSTRPSTSNAESAPAAPGPAWRSIDKAALAAQLGWSQVSRGNTARQRIALTFDAGEDGGPAPAILDVLKSAHVHCTFFVTGQFADKYPDLVRRMAADGHELGNHSYSHPKFPGLTPEQAASEISRTEQRVEELTGLSTKPYFRFPYGSGSEALVRQINGMGYIGVLWTFDTLDSMGASSRQIIDRVAKYACPGAIVLMHCGFAEEARALPSVIQELRDAGYEIATLTEVLAR
jgi:peptidoglycan/xylan/chitin deacetylase (PgdA/CDA1 family)